MPFIKEIRGRGLFNAIEIDPGKTTYSGYDICLKLMENGLLAKQTHENIIRFAPPLTITRKEIDYASDIIEETLMELI